MVVLPIATDTTLLDSVWIGVEMGTEEVVVDDEVGLTETIIDSVWIGVEIESIKRKLYENCNVFIILDLSIINLSVGGGL